MTLEQLRIFVAVAERQHVTRGAEALNLAQSAASTAIAALEAKYEAKLFHRIGRGIELTEAGRIFLIEAKAVLSRAEAAESRLSELSDLKIGTLAVQASQTIASYWLPHHLATFKRTFPSIAIRLTIGNTSQVAAAIRNGSAEIGFVEGAFDDPLLTATTVAKDQLELVVGADHPWASLEFITPDRLTETEWVLREPGSGTRSEFEAALVGFGVALQELRVVLELPSNESVRGAVEAGIGATAISASVAAPSLEVGLLHRVELGLPERAFYLVQHRERHLGAAAAALFDIVKNSGAPRAAPGPRVVSR
jgi:DNA-binding transcriptional LysR family regulator